MGERSIKFIVVDDHPLFRVGLAASLGERYPNGIILAASDANEALALVGGHGDFDLMLLDLRLPTVAMGLKLLNAIVAAIQSCRILVLTGESNEVIVPQVRAGGARGIISKNRGADALVLAIEAVLEGREYFPPSVNTDWDSSAELEEQDCPEFPPRLWDVYRLLADGAPNKVIGDKLCISEGSVKNYVTRILEAVGASNRSQAMVIYRNNFAQWNRHPRFRGAA